jgi:tRNA(Ile)-lysidine synthase
MASSRRLARAERERTRPPDAGSVDPHAALLAVEPRLGEGPVTIAFSGGLDSTVLLHAAVAVLPRGQLVAVHVDHGLQQGSSAWAEHCIREAAALGIICQVRRLEGQPAKGASIEAWAREGRYQAIGELARAAGASAILTAHHADDQLETFLIRLARGAGVEGLIGIEADRRLEGLRLLRPFLRVPRAMLVQWAQARQLRWIVDPSNADERLLRNAIRHQLVPVLDRVLPGVRRQLPSTLSAFAHARALLRERQSADLEAVSVSSNEYGLCLSRSAWRALPPDRRAGALRAWLTAHGLRMPSRARLAEMLVQLDSPRTDALPTLYHDGRVLRRYRDLIACIVDDRNAVRGKRAIPAPGPSGSSRSQAVDAASVSASAGVGGSPDRPASADRNHPDAESRNRRDAESTNRPASASPNRSDAGAPPHALPIRWEGQDRIECPSLGGTLRIERVDERDMAGLAAGWLRLAGLELRKRAGGERLRVHTGGPRRTLKNLFQERGVPPWVRTSLPVLWAGDKVVWVPRIGVDADCRTSSGERYRLWWLTDTSDGNDDQSGSKTD